MAALLTRSQFTIAQSLIAAVRCADSMFSATEHEQEFSRQGINEVADKVAAECTQFQLENAILALQVAFDAKRPQWTASQ